jgi:type I restriction enzyme M protein
MANPPFNVDGVDKGKDVVKKDPRLVLEGKVNLPKNDNANYLWIQYFYNYLKPTGRAGFVMASSASDAGHSERDIREKLVKTGSVDVMMAIGNNFFYTRSLPCTLWFFDRAKEPIRQAQGDSLRSADNVLMLDARKIYSKVTSKVNDFSPEQLQNLICIVNLYRGNTNKFESTVQHYLQTSANLAKETARGLNELQLQFNKAHQCIVDFAVKLAEQDKTTQAFADSLVFETIDKEQNKLISLAKKATASESSLEPIAQGCKNLRKPQDKLIKQLLDAISTATKEFQLSKNKDWKELNLKEQLDQLKALQLQLSGNPDEEEPGLLHETEYFYKQAHWLTSRFPDGVYTDVEGLCKVVSQAEIEAKDWSLSPGRYVGVDTATDDDVDYEQRLNEIHIELQGLNEEAIALAKTISENYKELVI